MAKIAKNITELIGNTPLVRLSKEPHSKLWGIRGRGATPQDYVRGRFHPASKLAGIQWNFL
jgi:hypothetical protein